MYRSWIGYELGSETLQAVLNTYTQLYHQMLCDNIEEIDNNLNIDNNNNQPHNNTDIHNNDVEQPLLPQNHTNSDDNIDNRTHNQV